MIHKNTSVEKGYKTINKLTETLYYKFEI